MDYEVSSGVTESGIILENNTMTVLDGGVATDTTVNSGGGVNISSGGTANSTIVNSFGYLHVSSGGTANSTTVNTSGDMYVGSSGMANNTTVDSGGLYVYSGGTATNIAVSDRGYLGLTVATDTYVQGCVDGSAFEMKDAFISGYVVHSGYLDISSDGTARSLTVNSGGSLVVQNGGTATEIVENGGYVSVADDKSVTFTPNTFSDLVLSSAAATIHSGTTANNTTINSGGRFYVYSGGTARNIIVSSGAKLFFVVAPDTYIQGRADGSAFEMKDSFLSEYTINSGCSLFVASGGTVSHPTVVSGGVLNIRSNGTATEIVENGGYVYVADGANAVFASNTISGLVLSNASATIHSGTTANSTTVNSRCTMYISSGGTANSTTVNSGGSLYVNFSGGIANSTTVSGYFFVNRGGVANSTIVNSGGYLIVSSGGTANNIIVNLSGHLDVSRDGIVSGITANKNGYVEIGNGAKVSNIIENGGCVRVLDSKGSGIIFASNTFSGLTIDNKDVATVHSGTTAYNTTLSGGTLQVFSGGMAVNTTIQRGGYLGSLFISSGGTAQNIAVTSGGNGNLRIFAGATITGRIYLEGTGLISSGTLNFDLSNIFPGAAARLNDYSRARSATFCITVNGAEQAEGIYTLAEKAQDFSETITVFDTDGAELGKLSVGETLTIFDTAYSLGLSAGVLSLKIGENNTLSPYTSEGLVICRGSSKEINSGEVFQDTLILSAARLSVLSGGIANGTLINSRGSFFIVSGGTANNTAVNYFGDLLVSNGGIANNTAVNEHGNLRVAGGGTVNSTTVINAGYLSVASGCLANNTTVNSGGSMAVSSDGKVTGKLTFEDGAVVSAEEGAILNFDLALAGKEALVNDLSIIQGTPVYTLTVDSDLTEPGSYVYALADGAENFASTISVVDKMSGDELGVLTVGETANINGTEYLLTNKDSELFVTVKCGDTPSKPKWTYLVYMAADSDISYCALYDIVSMQQANIDSEIEVYVLADRSTVDNPRNGDYMTAYGTYKWDSLWPDTRVGRITRSPGLTVTVDWESWGELDTGSIATLKRFLDWGQEQSPAENYGLIVWDHGRENTTLCFDRTTDPNGEACFTVSELSDLLKEKGNIPLVILNNCMLGSELVVTQMAGNTDAIVVSEPLSYGMSTYNYNAFFNTITADMTAQEMAAIMVQNVESPGIGGVVTMLTAVDVTVSRLAEPLEALAEAIASADNAADKTVLINALLKAPQDGCLYDGKKMQQSDLGFLIRDVMADPDYESTSGGFKKALADVKAALDAIVLEYRGVPAKRGSGIAVCNTVCSAENIVGSGDSVEKADSLVKSYIISTYKSNPLWGGLLYDLCSTYLAESADKISPPATFDVSYVDGLVPGGTVAVSDLGCFPGAGEVFNGIHVIGEAFFGFLITGEDKAAGGFTVANDIGAEVTVSLLASDGTVIGNGENGVSFEDLAAGTYYLRLQSGTNCHVTLSSTAEFVTGVDRFDYAGSGQNEAHVNGNGSIDQATPLDKGYYSGLITCKGDTDYYRIGDIHTKKCRIQVKGQDGWTVAEYDADGVLVQSAVFSDGQYNLTMDSLNYLLVEGASDLEDAIEPYTLNVIGADNDSDVVVLDDLTGTKDEVSWKSSAPVPQYTVQFSTDSFEHAFAFETAGTAVDLLGIPGGTYRWRVMAGTESENPWYDGEEFVSDNTNDKPRVFQSKADASDDVFFASPNGTWSSLYCAKHVGSVGDWSGTGEMVSAAGKGRIQDLFFGSVDPGTLCLTDSENGDALFLDDVYTVLPDEIEENTARLLRLQSIIAGAGDDIVDMTSQRFEYSGSKLFIYGGDGDDVIWAGKGRNMLFGDAGNDRIVGASGDDVLVGGIGDDSMHGGGGDDIFTFCENWGADTIEQIAEGSVTLWFATGDESKWDPEALTYTDGDNSVTVSGVSAENVTLKFGVEESEVFVELYYKKAFAEFASQKIFEQSGILASS